MNKTTFSLLEPIINSIDKYFYGTAIIDNGGNSYTITSYNTLWLTLGYTVTIDTVDYEITAIEPNESITITGSVLPTIKIFEIYPPFFTHGTIIAKNAELTLIPSLYDKYSMIFLHEKTLETFNHDPLSAIERESDCQFYFMAVADFSRWNTEDHYKYAVLPMRNLKTRFIDALKLSTVIGIFDQSKVMDEPKWGVYASAKGPKGSETQMLNDPLSGTGLNLTIPFLHQECPECEDNITVDTDQLHQYNFCNPVTFDRLTPSQMTCLNTALNSPVTLKNSDNSYEEDVTPGTTKVLNDTVVTQSDLTIENVPYNEPVTCQPHQGVDIFKSNGSTLVTHKADGTFYNIPKHDIFNYDATLLESKEFNENTTLAASTVTPSEGGSDLSLKPGEHYNCTPAVILPRIYAWPDPTGATVSYATGDDKYIQNLYFANQPASGKLVTLAPGNMFTLNENNEYGNTKRFTDTLGTQLYANNVLVDNFRGLEFYRVIQGTASWGGSISTALASNAASLNGWFVPNIKQLASIYWYGQTSPFGNCLSYPEFGADPTDTSMILWVSTSVPYDTGYKFFLNHDGRISYANSGTHFYLLCRKHT